MDKTKKINILYQMLNCYLGETILDRKGVEEAEILTKELEEAINYTPSCKSDSEQLCDDWIHKERVKQNDDTYCPICYKPLF